MADQLEALRKLSAHIESMEAQRARSPQGAKRLTRSVRALRRERRRLVLEAVAAGAPVPVVALAAQVTSGAVAKLVRAHTAEQPTVK